MKRLLGSVTLTILIESCMFFSSSIENTALVNRRINLQNTDARIYKSINGHDLQLHIFYPEGYSSQNKEKYPVAASFHGGAWKEGPIEWGYGDAKYLASLGFVGIAVEYRLADYKNISALDCIFDANSSVRWIRANATDLNVDPQRVLVIGHSAGGHLALCTAMFPNLMQAGEDKTISSTPNAVIALAPAVNLANDAFFKGLLNGRINAKKCSPADNIRNLNIPVLLLHGSEDEYLPITDIRDFVTKMNARGNTISFKEFPGGKHGLFFDNDEGSAFTKVSIRDFVRHF